MANLLTSPASTSFRIAATSSGDGDVLVAGDLLAVLGSVSTTFAVASPTCPASATAVGTGCSSTGADLQNGTAAGR